MYYTHKPLVLALPDGMNSICEEEGNIQHAVCTMYSLVSTRLCEPCMYTYTCTHTHISPLFQALEGFWRLLSALQDHTVKTHKPSILHHIPITPVSPLPLALVSVHHAVSHPPIPLPSPLFPSCPT